MRRSVHCPHPHLSDSATRERKTEHRDIHVDRSTEGQARDTDTEYTQKCRDCRYKYVYVYFKGNGKHCFLTLSRTDLLEVSYICGSLRLSGWEDGVFSFT